MATAAVSGINMTLTIEGDPLGESRSFTIRFAQSLIDATSRDSAQWGESILGRREWTIDFEGLYIYNDVAKKCLLNHYSAKSPAQLTCVITMPDTATYTGECYLTSMDFAGPYEDALTISGSLQGTGAIAVSVS